ncbi:MAG: RNB domain-containing ribonuclease [Bdellovibrionales bacterium]|nr:RNB domain-containing ribonuclease [Bdellovibrionales bacterium]
MTPENAPCSYLPMPLVPKQPLFDKSSNSFREGSLVIFDIDGASQLGVVLEASSQKARVLSMRGREQDLAYQRLGLLPGSIPSHCTTTQERSDWLLSAFESAERESASFPTEELWTFVESEKRDFTPDELCASYFGENQFEPHLRLRLALHKDKIFFKRRKHEFTPRPIEIVKELKLSESKRLEKEAKLALAEGELLALAKDRNYSLSPEVQPHVDLLLRVAAGAPHIDNNEHKEAKILIETLADKLSLSLRGSREDRAWNLLKRLKLLHKNSDLSPIRNALILHFSRAAEEAAAQLKECALYNSLPDEERAYRIDYSHVETVTIDDSSTNDMDDALSVERTPEGYRLGIHITDVATAIERDSLLDQEVKARATSTYLPDRTINMFPDILANQTLSLIAGAPRRTLSFLIDLDNQFQVASYRIVPTVISVDQRLTYEEVELLLKSPTGLIESLYMASSAYESHRIAQGALKIPKKESAVFLSDKANLEHSEIRLEEFDEQSPARNLIGELMILANACAADYAARNNLPFIFRSQPPSDPVDQGLLNSIPPGPALDYILRSGLKRSTVSTTPAPHATLGLQAYAQVTSPIRRYTDLVNQRQLFHHIVSGETLLAHEQIDQYIEETSSGLSRARITTRESKRFWLYRVLEGYAREKKRVTGTILRDDQRHYLVELDELFIPVYLKTGERYSRGDVLSLSIAAVDAKSEYLKLEVVSKLPS